MDITREPRDLKYYGSEFKVKKLN